MYYVDFRMAKAMAEMRVLEAQQQTTWGRPLRLPTWGMRLSQSVGRRLIAAGRRLEGYDPTRAAIVSKAL